MPVTVSDIRWISMTGRSSLAAVSRRYGCRGSEIRTDAPLDIFPVGHIFNYVRPRGFFAGTSARGRLARYDNGSTARILFLARFPSAPTTCLSCARRACYLRLSTARHSCLINKLQLIAHVAVERITRRARYVGVAEYVYLVLINARARTRVIYLMNLIYSKPD